MGGISLMNIVDKMAEILAADTALQAWCATHYKAPIIQIGLDTREPPQAEDMPVILVRPTDQGLGPQNDDEPHTVQVDWGVHDDTVTVTGLVKEYVGVRRVDEMGRLIWAALDTGLPPVLSLTRTEYVLETVEKFPMCLGGMDITINVPAMLSGHLTL